MKKTLSLVILLCIMFSLSGCWDSFGLEDNYTVTGIGIDIDESSSDTILVSFVGPGKPKSNTASASEPQDTYFNIKASGDSILSATIQAQNKTNKNISINNLRVIVFSENIARKGIAKYIDSFIRNAQINPNTIVVVTNKTAKELLILKSELVSKIPMYIIDLLNSSDFKTNKSFYTLKEVNYALSSNYKGFVIPYILLNSEEKEITYEQVCLFKEDKMVDLFSESDTLSYFLLNGIFESDEYSIDNDHTGKPLKNGSSFHLVLDKRKFDAIMTGNNEINFNLNLKIKCTTIEKVNNNTVMNSENDKDSLQKKYETAISYFLKESIIKILDKLQKQYNVDSLSFGEYIRVKYPDFFDKIIWQDEFAKAKFNVDISVKIENSGIINLE